MVIFTLGNKLRLWKFLASRSSHQPVLESNCHLSMPFKSWRRADVALGSPTLASDNAYFSPCIFVGNMGGVKKHKQKMQKSAEKAREYRKRIREGRERNEEEESNATEPTPSTSHAHLAPQLPAPTRAQHLPPPTLTCSSAKKRKLEVYHALQPSNKTTVDDENLILKKSYLQEVFTHVSCSHCYGKLKVTFVNKFMDYKIDLECEECGNKCGNSDVKDTPVTNSIVYSAMDVGLGYSGFHTLTGNMSMKPLLKNYGNIQSIVLDKTKAKTEEVLKKSIEAAKKHYSHDKEGIYDVRVIYDGSWQKRGHTSMLAVGAVIDAETNCVLDYETVSKYCEVCTKKENCLKRGKVNQEEFDEWLTGHKDKCLKNYEGSSGGMEAAAAMRLFSRSLDNKMRYTVFISDGDSSAYNAICNMNDGKGPYNGITIAKGECINHVGKRLGTALRKVREQVVTEKKTKTGKTRRVKEMGGKGKLTDFVMGKLQKYYSAAIRRHVGGTVEELRKDIYASFLHCSSTDNNPQHHLCPKTPDSYCFYQRAKATNKPVPSHKTMKVSFQLSSELRQKVWGEYKRLTSDKILSACLLGKTQNPNEHLHSRIWRYCSKYKNANKIILDFSVAQAVLDYNVGYQEGFIVPLLGEPFTEIHKSTLKKRDEKRERVRCKRKHERMECVTGDYEAGAF